MTSDITDLEQARYQIEMARAGHRHGQRGLFALADLPQRPSVAQQSVSPGWDCLAELWRIYPGQFSVVCGVPSHGKSTLVLNVIANVAKLYGMASFIFCPENESFLRSKLRRIYGDQHFDSFARSLCIVQSSEIESYDQEPKTLQWVLDHALIAVQRDGVKLIVIDPWNELEHAKPRDMPLTDYIAHCLRWLKQFARAHQVSVIVCAHPTKGHASDGRKVTLYDIEGSAAWFNRCDSGLIVSRDAETDAMIVTSAKCRERGAGRRGTCHLFVDDDERIATLSGVRP